MNIPESFASNALPPQWTTFNPVFPGGPPRTAVMFDPDYYRDFALPWDPVHEKVWVCLLRMGSPFPPVPWSSCAQAPWPSMPDAPGALSPSARSPGMGVWCGAQNSHSCRWVSVNQLLSCLWIFPPGGMGLHISCNQPTTSWCVLLFVFWCRISFLIVCSLFGWRLFNSWL